MSLHSSVSKFSSTAVPEAEDSLDTKLRKYQLFMTMYIHEDRTYSQIFVIFGSLLVVYLGLISGAKVPEASRVLVSQTAAFFLVGIWFFVMSIFLRLRSYLRLYHRQMTELEKSLFLVRANVVWWPTSYSMMMLITFIAAFALLLTIAPALGLQQLDWQLDLRQLLPK